MALCPKSQAADDGSHKKEGDEEFGKVGEFE